jgi:hypothetical protein
MPDTRSDKQLQKEVKDYSAFRSHATIYVLVIGALWILWLLSGSAVFYTWLLAPSLLWGFILAIHWFLVYREIKNDQRS